MLTGARMPLRTGVAATLAGVTAALVLTLAGTPAGAATVAPEPVASPAPTTSPSPAATPEPSESPTVEVSASPEPTPEPSATAEAPADASSGPKTTLTLSPTVGVLAAESVLESPFTDVSAVRGTSAYSVFAAEIAWMHASGISTGWSLADGTSEYRPFEAVTREQMAAFLHRFAGSPVTALPKASPFTDVSTKATFFTQISWMWRSGLATGWTTSTGAVYRPVASITREQMAAFLYRAAGSPAFEAPSTPSFTDVPSSATFATEIEWLADTGISEGWATSTGAEFRPTSAITREQMAAFLFRMDQLGLTPVTDPASTLRHSTLYVYGASSLNFRAGPGTSYASKALLTEGTAVQPTGVTDGAWIQVKRDGTLLWARSDYLIGRNGAAYTRIRSLYTNGTLPDKELCGLTWDSVEFLECTAAYDLELLNRAFYAEFDMNIPLNDSYRDYDTQVLYKQIYGDLAATPGTSNHGWGQAIDISTARLPGGTDGAAYTWLTQRLGVYNWVHPTWARTSGTKPEAWHFEYTG